MEGDRRRSEDVGFLGEVRYIRGAMPRHLFIVSRDNPELHAYLKAQFDPDADVEVILDRRRGERRAPSSRSDIERRASDRRSRPEIDVELRSSSHAFLTLSDPPPSTGAGLTDSSPDARGRVPPPGAHPSPRLAHRPMTRE
jgi:hypothetical protein